MRGAGTGRAVPFPGLALVWNPWLYDNHLRTWLRTVLTEAAATLPSH
ncbi:hypothetical protein [Streptomyces carminius]|nr:hypothetical protein [Streptomyces carminius]